MQSTELTVILKDDVRQEVTILYTFLTLLIGWSNIYTDRNFIEPMYVCTHI